MRILVATTAGSGHFAPLVPIARACLAAGHAVAVTAPGSFAAAVAREGLEHLPFADADPAELGAVFGSLDRNDIAAGNRTVAREVFGRINTTAAKDDVDAIVAAWRPDVILRESAEFSSLLAAEARGIPHVHMAIGLAAFDDHALPAVEEPLIALGARPGLVERIHAVPHISLLPMSYEDPGHPGPANAVRVREEPLTPEPLPDWWPGDERPLVYVTFGTAVPVMGLFPDVYRAVVGALAGLDARVLMTVGAESDPTLLGELPPNVHVERFWPQHEVLPVASAVVGHGGMGTTLATLAAGLPSVVMPFFADQPDNARRVDALGAGVVVSPEDIGELCAATQRVLTEPAFRAAAEAVAAEIAALPPAGTVVPLLEEVAAGR